MSIVVSAARLHALRAHVDDDIAMAFGPMRYRAVALVELETSSGLTGFGESWVNHPEWAIMERIATLEQGVFPLIRGAAVADVRKEHVRLLHRLEPLGRQWGAPGPIWQAVSGIDIALWDLFSRAAGYSLSNTIGRRCRDEIAAYASSLGPRNVPLQAATCEELGFQQVKVRVGFGRKTDEENLTAVRRILGDAVSVFVDANQAWSLPEALEMVPVLQQYNIAWIEEPIRGNALDHLETLAGKTGVQIATGENVYGVEGFLPYIRSKAVTVLQPDVTKTGGLTEAFAICRAAADEGKTVVPHAYGGPIAFAATLQLAACCAAVEAVEFDIRQNPLAYSLVQDSPSVRSGVLSIPAGLGLGVEVNMQSMQASEAVYSAVVNAPVSVRGIGIA